jgi:hypothetical protein
VQYCESYGVVRAMERVDGSFLARVVTALKWCQV